MKKLIYIATLLVLLFSTGDALACRSSSDKAPVEKSCCTSNGKKSNSKCCCESKSDTNKRDCNGACKNIGCQTVLMVASLPANDFTVWFPSVHMIDWRGWEFIENAPKNIFISIWQPPKIS